MALWTPYAQEIALDLSKGAVNATPKSPPVLGACQHYASYATYPYQPPSYTVPSTSISPDSLERWSQNNSTEFYDSESLSEDQEYLAFERDALRAMAAKNGGTLLGNNPRMRRAVQTSQTADGSYRKQRERNNYAAKMSRDRRKLRELRLAIQVTYLKKKMAHVQAKLSASVCERCRQFRE